MPELFPPSLAEQILAVEREIRMREQVYPRRVAAAKMSQKAADREIATMRAVLDTLRAHV
jgi:hypothetical protein